jgi:hypothetical protein
VRCPFKGGTIGRQRRRGGPAAGVPRGAGSVCGQAHNAEQRSGERTGAGTGTVATWRRREGGYGRPTDGARPAAAQDQRVRAARSGHVVRPTKQERGKGADQWAVTTVLGGSTG